MNGQNMQKNMMNPMISFQQMEEMVKRDLEDLTTLLNQAGVDFWLTSGTLLGCVSRGGILPNDRDVDLGTWAAQRNKVSMIIPVLIEKGFAVKQRYDPAHNKIKGMITLRRGAAPIDIKLYDDFGDYVARGIHRSLSARARAVWEVIDILYFERHPAELVNYLAQLWRNGRTWYGMEILPKKYFEKFQTVDFYGMKVNIFEKAEDYLNEEYGMDWSTHNPSGIGGADKYSHVIYSKDLLKEIGDDEELLRRCKAVGYI